MAVRNSKLQIKIVLRVLANKINEHNAGLPHQFRCRGSRHRSGVREFCRYAS